MVDWDQTILYVRFKQRHPIFVFKLLNKCLISIRITLGYDGFQAFEHSRLKFLSQSALDIATEKKVIERRVMANRGKRCE
jgi:hypothetical protein